LQATTVGLTETFCAAGSSGINFGGRGIFVGVG
jgi:hypothetical protein